MIIVFNGPPGSGKDEAADLYKEQFGFKSLSFKYQLFKKTIEHFEVDKDWFMEGYDNREIKERKEPALNNMSRREALIHTSEDIIKPKFGKQFFGKCVAEEIDPNKNYAISDSGFVEELYPIVEKVGAENVVLVQLTRQGHDFSSDSRRYVQGNLVKEYAINGITDINEQHILPNDMNIKTYRIHNNGSLRSFHNTLKDIFEELNDASRQIERDSSPEHN